jgi:branched-chain amino acid transport system substrate-binding protein
MIELQTFDDSSGEASWKGFKAEFVERFLGEPSFAAVAAYDAAAAVLAAFSSRKPGQSLKEALLSGGPYQGLQQSIAFDRFGDTVRNKTFTAIVGGAYVKVE